MAHQSWENRLICKLQSAISPDFHKIGIKMFRKKKDLSVDTTLDTV